MNHEQLYREAANALSRGDVETLVNFWFLSTKYREGEEIRELITEGIKKLAHDHQIDYKGDSFRDFVKKYDETLLDRECGEDADACLAYFSGLGHVKGVLRSIERGAQDWEGAIDAAAENGRLSIIEELLWPEFRTQLKRPQSNMYSSFLENALKSGNWPIIQFISEKSLHQQKNLIAGVFTQVIDSGNLELMKYVLEEWKRISPEKDEIVRIVTNRSGKVTRTVAAGPIKLAIRHAVAAQADDMLELLLAA